MNKKVLVIVPHEDDEINLCGSLFSEKEYDFYIAFVTNGDYSICPELRQKEAIKSLRVLSEGRITKEEIFFLGYPDQCWNRGQEHIWNAHGETYVSKYGKNKTYRTNISDDFRYRLDGTHSKYNIESISQDLLELINIVKPDIIYATDMDKHPDHMMTSLIVEKTIGIWLKDNSLERVYKGFAYNTAFYSKIGRNRLNLPSTKKVKLDNYVYEWKDRVRFPVNKKCRCNNDKLNLISIALLQHESQKIYEKKECIIRADKVFWERNTDSISYRAIFSASSGETEYLNDFIVFSLENVMKRRRKYCDFWEPDREDKERKIHIEFIDKKVIDRIILYEKPGILNHIRRLKIKFSNGYSYVFKKVNKIGKASICEFPQQKDVNWIEIVIEKCYGKIGIGEIEIFEPYISEIEFIKIMNGDDFIYEYSSLNKYLKLCVYAYGKGVNRILRSDEYDLVVNGKVVSNMEPLKLYRYDKIITIEAYLRSNEKIHDEIIICNEKYMQNKLCDMQMNCINIYNNFKNFIITNMKKIRYIIWR